MHLSVTTEAAGLLMIALAIFAHAWVQRVSPQPIANIVGWVVIAITAIVICSRFLHCG